MPKRKYDLIAFDLDGTLVDVESCWGALHKYFGTDEAKVSESMRGFHSGAITYSEWMRADTKAWLDARQSSNGKLIHISELEEHLSVIRLVKNAKETLEALKTSGYRTAIVSCGLDVLADKVGKTLGVDHVFANGLEVDEDGYLTGRDICRVRLFGKYRVLRELSAMEGIPLAKFVGVTDSRVDMDMLGECGLKVAFCSPDRELNEMADVVIKEKDMGMLLNYV